MVRDVAFVADAAYLPWVATAMLSALDSGADDLRLHLVHDGSIGATDADLLRAMVDGAGGDFVEHAVTDDRTDLLPAVARFGRIVWLRFLLPELVDADRVLYLDADTFVAQPLDPLWSLDLDGHPLAAVPNVVSPTQHDRIAALGADPRRFLNTGVLLLDLPLLRDRHVMQDLRRFAMDRAEDLRWPDQDALNVVLGDGWKELHPRWNAQNSLWTWRGWAEQVLGADAVAEALAAPAILHFEGPTLMKPWHTINGHPWRRRYRATSRRTPFAAPLEDHTVMTQAIRSLPPRLRAKPYVRLLEWRIARGLSEPYDAP
jgi:lipopolysaccharide biosynthesis glycosyltransferase